MYIFHYSSQLLHSTVGRPIEVGAEGILTLTGVSDRLEKEMAMREAAISANYKR